MKKILNAFSKERLQRVLFLGMIVLVFGVFVISMITTNNSNEEQDPNENNPPIENNDPNEVVDPNPETKPKEKYKAPCDLTICSAIRHFYSLEDDTAMQEMSLIQCGNKYFISRGISYKNENNDVFDVVASLTGTVTEVTESSMYGTTIVIDHGNDIKTEYLGVSNVLVKVGDTVSQDAIIASSGAAEYDVASGNHVHFRVSLKGTYIDPETVIDKEIE